MRRSVRIGLLTLVLASVLLVGLLGVAARQNALAEPQTKGVSVENTSTEENKFPGGHAYAIADIAEEISPAVVYITVKWPATPVQPNPFMSDPFFRDFFRWFGEPMLPETEQPESSGTGFIIDDKGHILTNQHVVGNLGEDQEIRVKISTEDFSGEVPAKLLGSDYRLDLAVLKIEKPKELAKLPTARLGDSDKSRPGEWVVAIGNPYGEQFEHTVTVGVLSAKGRRIQIPDYERRTYRVYENLMQTDAAINPGNSGGPLINVKGEVIGINTAVNAAAQGIGFAIPINTAKQVVGDLINEGKVVRETTPRAWVGIYPQQVDERIASFFGLPEPKGVIVAEVVLNSPAAKAGLRMYDIILRVDNTEIETEQQFRDLIASHKPGDKVIFSVLRNGSRIVIPVVLGDWPEE